MILTSNLCSMGAQQLWHIGNIWYNLFVYKYVYNVGHSSDFICPHCSRPTGESDSTTAEQIFPILELDFPGENTTLEHHIQSKFFLERDIPYGCRFVECRNSTDNQPIGMKTRHMKVSSLRNGLVVTVNRIDSITNTRISRRIELGHDIFTINEQTNQVFNLKLIGVIEQKGTFF